VCVCVCVCRVVCKCLKIRSPIEHCFGRVKLKETCFSLLRTQTRIFFFFSRETGCIWKTAVDCVLHTFKTVRRMSILLNKLENCKVYGEEVCRP